MDFWNSFSYRLAIVLGLTVYCFAKLPYLSKLPVFLAYLEVLYTEFNHGSVKN